jgi:hypothetical protein
MAGAGHGFLTQLMREPLPLCQPLLHSNPLA